MGSETYRELGGGIPEEAPPCSASFRCDGMGMNRFLPARTRGFVECSVHRPAPTFTPARPLRRRLRAVS